jgi:hypothetical protein
MAFIDEHRQFYMRLLQVKQFSIYIFFENEVIPLDRIEEKKKVSLFMCVRIIHRGRQ